MPVRDVTSITRDPAHQQVQRERFSAWPAVEKVARGVDMRPAVGAHVERGHVRAIALARRLIGSETERGVIRVGGERRVERHRDVDEFHEAAKSRMIA